MRNYNYNIGVQNVPNVPIVPQMEHLIYTWNKNNIIIIICVIIITI